MAGALRTGAVYIERSAYLPPQLPQVVDEMFALFLARAADITDPFEQSFFALVHIPYLQPFADVNQRTARLAANIPLVRENLCPLSFVDVTERDNMDAVLGVYERLDTRILRDLNERLGERPRDAGCCESYGHKRILVVEIGGYAFVVPHVQQGNRRLLKTTYRSRVYPRKYLGSRRP